MVIARVWGEGRNGQLLFNGYRILVYKMKRGLEMDGGGCCVTDECI